MDEKFLSISSNLSHLNQLRQNQRIGNRLKNAKNQTDDHNDPQLQAACAEMESLFISHLLKEMRATVEKSGFMDGGQAEEIFTSLLDVEISKKNVRCRRYRLGFHFVGAT
jgi:flagellar protein FlgJ